jgi:methionyl aminopeptidase
MISIKSKEEVRLMRESGRIAAQILKKVQDFVKPGISTKELDDLAEKLIGEYKVKSAFKGYPSGKKGEQFPGVLCTSLNNVVVHGVPSDIALKEGDILGLDFGIVYKNYYSDLAVTVPVGNISDEARRLIRITKKALKRGLKKVRQGNTIGDIGNTIDRYVKSQGYKVVRDLCGHGIGKDLHEEPEVPNFGKRRSGAELVEGMVIAIEPMVVAGSWELAYSSDSHGFETKDKSLSAHFEHTVAVTKDGAEVLTYPQPTY